MNASSNALAGISVVLSRAAGSANDLARAISDMGANLTCFDVLDIVGAEDFGPLDAALANLARYDWLVVTSRNAVRAISARMQMGSLSPNQHRPRRVAAIGARTAEELQSIGWNADLIPEQWSATGILEALSHLGGQGNTRIQRVLLPQSDLADSQLARGLTRAGFDVDAVLAYRTRVNDDEASNAACLLSEGRASLVVFTSPSAARAVLDRVNPVPRGLRVVAVGQSTGRECAGRGIDPVHIANTPTADGITAALLETDSALM